MKIDVVFGTKTGIGDPLGYFLGRVYGEIDSREITRIGKMAMYGRSGCYLVFETATAHGIIVVSKQSSEEAKKILQKVQRAIKAPSHPKGLGDYCILWAELNPLEVCCNA